jgi:hypothetical protein
MRKTAKRPLLPLPVSSKRNLAGMYRPTDAPVVIAGRTVGQKGVVDGVGSLHSLALNLGRDVPVGKTVRH